MANNYYDATGVLMLLSGINDDKLRATLQRYVAECLLASSSST